MLRTLLKLFRLLTPLRVIASELTIMRELMEAEMASRATPIYRVTEKPRKDDTEVSYGIPDERAKHKRGFELAVEDDDDDEDLYR